MQGAQNKKKTPGAFRSSLIPYSEQIFTWWFDERLSATKIQELLREQFNVDVHRTTLSRFIQVRRERPDPHERPEHLKKAAAPKLKVKNARPKPLPAPRTPAAGGQQAEGEALLNQLENSTPQELWNRAHPENKG